MFNKKTYLEMIRFAIVGIVSTLLNYAIYWVLQKQINVSIAFSIGYLISFIVNYWLTAKFTFKKEKSVKNGIGFTVAHICNYVIQVLLLNFFIYLGVDKEYAPIPMYCIAVPINFIMVRTVFKKLK